MQRHIWGQRDDSSGDIGGSYGQSALHGALGIGLLKAQLEAHHEIDPLLWLARQRLHYGAALLARETVISEDILDFPRLLLGDLLHLARLALPFARVVLGVALGGEITAQAHGDRSRGDLGQSRDDHNVTVVNGPRKSRRQRKRDGE